MNWGRYYDLQYEAWRSGRNPDNLSMDEFDYYQSLGYQSEEISLEMIYPEREQEQENSDANA